MPILISTALLSATEASPSRLASGPGGSGRAGPAADTAPGEPRQQLLGGVLGYRPAGTEPVPGAHLGHADQGHAQQVRLVAGQAGVFADELADHVGTCTHRAVQAVPDGGLVAEIGLEHQAECLAGTADEVEEGLEGRWHALLIVRGGGRSA